MKLKCDPIYLAEVKVGSGTQRLTLHVENLAAEDYDVILEDLERPEWIDLQVIEQKAEEKRLSERINELASRRDGFIKEVDPEALDRYEKILKNRGRTALAAVNGEFCGECNMQLRPQIINDARLKKVLVLCENCGRILYVEN